LSWFGHQSRLDQAPSLVCPPLYGHFAIAFMMAPVGCRKTDSG